MEAGQAGGAKEGKRRVSSHPVQREREQFIWQVYRYKRSERHRQAWGRYYRSYRRDWWEGDRGRQSRLNAMPVLPKQPKGRECHCFKSLNQRPLSIQRTGMNERDERKRHRGERNRMECTDQQKQSPNIEVYMFFFMGRNRMSLHACLGMFMP